MSQRGDEIARKRRKYYANPEMKNRRKSRKYDVNPEMKTGENEADTNKS